MTPTPHPDGPSGGGGGGEGQSLSQPPPHLIVHASAGAGKTYSLATRYLTLLRRGAPANSILATTFTRKAAGEILGRVLVRLARAAMDKGEARQLSEEFRDPSLTHSACRTMLADLCSHLHGVAISTLDSFFVRVAQSFRYELALPPVSAIAGMGDPRITQIRHRAIEALLAEDEPAVLLDLLRRLHHDTATRSVTRAIDEIVRALYEHYRSAPDEACWSRIQPPAGLAKPALERAGDQVVELLDQFAKNKRIAKALRESLQLVEAQDWDSLLESGLTGRIAAGDGTYYKAPIDPQIIAALTPFVLHAKAIVLGRYVRMNEATYRLMQRFDRHFTRLREEQGLLLFADLPYRLGQLMTNGGDEGGLPLAELYYRLDAKVGHLLLDEFQDTSPEQWRILLPLAQEICAHGDGSRTFFCVGDAKQAIYGWRGGSAALFDNLAHDLHLPAASLKTLSVSYRSTQPVLDAVNQVFGGDAPGAILQECAADVAEWQAGFVPHETSKEGMPGYVELVTSTAQTGASDDEAADDGRSPQPVNNNQDPSAGQPSPTPHEDFAADHIARIFQQSPGRSIGVLVGRNATVRLMIDLLRARSIRASGEGGVPVTDDAAVNVVLSAMIMADHPGDTISAFHVFHSPLAAILGLTKLEPALVQRVALQMRMSLAQDGYARVIARWSGDLAPSCDARSLLRLEQLVELAGLYDPSQTLRPRQFVEFVATTPVEEPSPAPVRVMTIHKAKGLEFDVAVLPELDHGIVNLGQVEAYLERPSATGPVTGVFRSCDTVTRDLAPEIAQACQQETARRLHDDLSTLYVAMTRPRYALHMIVRPLKPKKDGSAGAQGLTNKTFASILRHALADEDEEDFAGNQTLYCRGDPAWHAQAPPSPDVEAMP